MAADRSLMSAVRAMHDCGVIRASCDDAGFIAAQQIGFADFRLVAGNPDKLDFFLNQEGRDVAAHTFGAL